MIPYDMPIILEQIFFDYDRATLRPESKQELDSLVAILHNYPDITIELTAHTDRHGDEAYNLDLSTRRAQSVLDYLVANGICEERIQAVGRGETEPITVGKSIADRYDFLRRVIALRSRSLNSSLHRSKLLLIRLTEGLNSHRPTYFLHPEIRLSKIMCNFVCRRCSLKSGCKDKGV